MGKVVKTLAVIAVAAAIAYFAPQLGLYALHALGSTAVAGSAAAFAASAAVAATLSIAASAALQAFAGKPSTTTAPGRQPTRGQPMTQTGITRAYPAAPSALEMQPIHRHWAIDQHFYPGQRFAMVRTQGNCMGKLVRDYIILDRSATVRAGDLIEFTPDDLPQYLHAAGAAPGPSGLVKRFVGADWGRRVMVFETTNPPNRAETGVDRLKSLARVRGTADGWRAAYRLLRAIRRDPDAFDDRLAA